MDSREDNSDVVVTQVDPKIVVLVEQYLLFGTTRRGLVPC